MVAKFFLLDKPTITIGSSADSDIQIDQPGVSAKHAGIRVVPGEFMESHSNMFSEDLGSRNGALITDEQVTRCQLRPNGVTGIA
jgi:pSer/pThr/pTyr-binding forkhead associated (FHA) protein